MGDSTERYVELAETPFSERWYTNLSTRAQAMPALDLLSPRTDAEGLRQIRRIFDPVVSAVHGIEAHSKRVGHLRKNPRPFGKSWIIDPAFGEGECWYAAIDSDIVVSTIQMRLERRAVITGCSADMVCLSLGGGDMPAYYTGGSEALGPALFGYAWRAGHRYRQIVNGCDRLRSCSVSMLPRALGRMAAQLGIEARELMQAVLLLDGHRAAPRLARALEELADARPVPATAPAYYRAKVIECLALLIESVEDGCGGPGTPAQRRDRLCGALSHHVETHLGQDLSTRELCRLFHVSETTLARAFRRMMQTTPQQFVRGRRMEHAQRLLRMGGLDVRQVAEAVGYGNQGSFAEAFKAHCGMTPSLWRARRD